jgi:hypothetical protein
MRPTRFIAPGSAPSGDLDTPAYTRGPTSLPEFQPSQAQRAVDRADASNRAFNQQFWATLASEAGGVPNKIDMTRLARRVSGILVRKQPGG